MDRTLLMFALVVTCFCFLEVSGQNPEVQIGLGRLQGMYESVQRGNDQYRVKNFLGIPFAKPPVGDLRFRKPEPVDSLGSNPYNASYYRPYCPHMTPGSAPQSAWFVSEDEDCLYLNVFVPDTQSETGTTHAVMVWIYGGGYSTGAASDYHSAMLAASGNVIVVTLNYRIGMLGFMSTMDDSAPGNYGMFDQVLAIHWVHENIADFGGDPTRVTVFGESAGAMSTSLQALYEGNHGKMQRIIAQSGTANNPMFSLTNDRLTSAKFIGKELMCPTDDSYKMVECLRSIPWKQIQTTLHTLAADPANMPYLQSDIPRLDGDFVKTDFSNFANVVNSYGKRYIEYFQSLDAMVGCNSHEGSLMLGLMLAYNQGTTDVTPEVMNQIIQGLSYIQLIKDPVTPALSKVIAHEYTDWANLHDTNATRLQVVKMLGDASFVVPATETALVHAGDDKDRGTYVYQFMPATSQRMAWTESWLPGADHAEELPILFGYMYQNLTSWEKDLSDRMVTYWSNFAKTGNPNEPRSVTHNWAAYNRSHQAYMALDEDNGENPVHLYFSARETHFWRQTIPAIQAEVTSVNPGHCGGDVSASVQLLAPLLAPLLAVFVALM